MSDLATKTCKPCNRDTPRVTGDELSRLLAALDGWSLGSAQDAIERTFEFSNYYETMAFVNAIAFIAHREDHHPDLEVSFKHCVVRYATHAVGGLSENDFICAAKVERLLAEDGP